MNRIDAALVPILRRDLVAQGPRYVVQIGDKSVDYNDNFQLFMCTQNADIQLAPDLKAIITEVNFTTTRDGLTSQVLL
jgi:dynein heavy chain 2